MPKTFEKTRKEIAKKKKGNLSTLHEKSRDARKLHKAQVRDERLEKLAEARKKRDQPLLRRASFFQQAVRDAGLKPMEAEAIHAKVKEYVHQFDEEYNELKKARRPGRPPTTKEDLLRMKMEKLQKEYQDGFYMPDLSHAETVSLLDKWGGDWSYLTNLTWVRLSASGAVKPAKFPPQTL